MRKIVCPAFFGAFAIYSISVASLVTLWVAAATGTSFDVHLLALAKLNNDSGDVAVHWTAYGDPYSYRFSDPVFRSVARSRFRELVHYDPAKPAQPGAILQPWQGSDSGLGPAPGRWVRPRAELTLVVPFYPCGALLLVPVAAATTLMLAHWRRRLGCARTNGFPISLRQKQS